MKKERNIEAKLENTEKRLQGVCTANFVAEQLERLRNMTDDERWDFFIKFFSPSADAEWIPVSERLPSEDGRYLVTYPLFVRKDKWVNVLWYGKPSMPNIKVKGKCWYRSDDEYGDVVYDDVIAWMPLPKPYREEGEE